MAQCARLLLLGPLLGQPLTVQPWAVVIYPAHRTPGLTAPPRHLVSSPAPAGSRVPSCGVCSVSHHSHSLAQTTGREGAHRDGRAVCREQFEAARGRSRGKRLRGARAVLQGGHADRGWRLGVCSQRSGGGEEQAWWSGGSPGPEGSVRALWREVDAAEVNEVCSERGRGSRAGCESASPPSRRRRGEGRQGLVREVPEG